jgi:hypothetical protein
LENVVEKTQEKVKVLQQLPHAGGAATAEDGADDGVASTAPDGGVIAEEGAKDGGAQKLEDVVAKTQEEVKVFQQLLLAVAAATEEEGAATAEDGGASTAPDGGATAEDGAKDGGAQKLEDVVAKTQDEKKVLQQIRLDGGAATAGDGGASTAPAPPFRDEDGSEAGHQDGGGQDEDDQSQNNGSDSEGQTVWKEGKLMCFVSAKKGYQKKPSKPQYGILAVDVNEESLFGTCIMGNGDFVSYSFAMLYASVERYKDESVRLACPTSQLKGHLMICKADQKAFKIKIREAVAEYKKSNRGPFPSSGSEESPMQGGPLSNPFKVIPYHMNP